MGKNEEKWSNLTRIRHLLDWNPPSDESPTAVGLSWINLSCCDVMRYISGCRFPIFVIFTSTWGNYPIWRAYFSDGVVQPATRFDLSSKGRVFTLQVGKGRGDEATADPTYHTELFWSNHSDLTVREITLVSGKSRWRWNIIIWPDFWLGISGHDLCTSVQQLQEVLGSIRSIRPKHQTESVMFVSEPLKKPPWSLTVRPWKVTKTQKERIIFQPSFFRGELLNLGGVARFSSRTSYFSTCRSFTGAAECWCCWGIGNWTWWRKACTSLLSFLSSNAGLWSIICLRLFICLYWYVSLFGEQVL